MNDTKKEEEKRVKRNFKIAVIVAFLLSAVMMIQCSDKKVSAYNLNGVRLKNPRSVGICSDSAEYGTQICRYAKTWNIYSALHLVESNPATAKILASIGDGNNGDYGVTYHLGSKQLIVFYPLWLNTTVGNQNETIVHEFGHAVGLAHCDAKDNSISVMRQYGFNQNAFPLSDDRAGIRALYK